MFDEQRLPPGARLVHVGPPKTGTTAVQSAFVRVRDQLPSLGVHYAGPGSRPRDAVVALTGTGASARNRPPMAAWSDLVKEVRGAGSLRVCVSNEQFSAADATAARKLVDDLGGDDVHLIMVVRPLHALLPSQWQQRVRRHRNMVDYGEWLHRVLGDDSDDEHHRHFWRLHDVAAQIDKWAAAASPERVLVVVSDERDREFLPRLFEGLLALPDGILVPLDDRTNRSLDLSEAELLRALDRIAEERGWERDLYVDDVKPSISKYLRGRPRDLDNPITLPGWALDRVAELNAARVHVLETTTAQVIGDPATLDTEASPNPPAPSDHLTVAVDVAAGAAGVGVERILQRQAKLEGQVVRLPAALEGTRRKGQRTEGRRDDRPCDGKTLQSAGARELVRALADRTLRRLGRFGRQDEQLQ